MRIEVFIDYGSSAEKIATFYDDESYQYCVAALELVAKNCGGVLTESLVDDQPSKDSEKERSSNFHPDNQRELSSMDSDLNFIEGYLSDDYPLRKSEKELLQSMIEDCQSWAEDDGLEPSDVKEVISRVDSISKKLANFPTKGEQS